MIIELSLKAVLPIVIALEKEKIMMPGVLLIEDGKIRVGLISSVFFDETMKIYDKLKKEGYKSVNFEYEDIMKIADTVTIGLQNFLMDTFIEGIYGKEIKEKLAKIIEETPEINQLIELMKKMQEKKEDTMVR